MGRGHSVLRADCQGRGSRPAGCAGHRAGQPVRVLHHGQQQPAGRGTHAEGGGGRGQGTVAGVTGSYIYTTSTHHVEQNSVHKRPSSYLHRTHLANCCTRASSTW